MRRSESALFAPYRSMGVVCAGVKPAYRFQASRNRPMTSVVVAVDNVVLHYKAEKLRLVAVSDVMPHPVSAVAADAREILAASGDKIAMIPTCRHVKKWLHVGAETKHMLIMGDQVIVVDVNDGIRVIDMESGATTIHLDGSPTFKITSLVHPDTYMNKIIVGSECGSLRIINIRTGKIVHTFKNRLPGAVDVAVQSPAIDVLAFGLRDGSIHVMNVKTDETICRFRHDQPITAIGFRNDGEPLMTSADESGDLAIWNLEKRELLGKLTGKHRAAVHSLYFLPAQPIMVSTSADNSMNTWILDGADGMPRQLVALEGHAQPVSTVTFSAKHDVLSSGLDGSVRKHSVIVDTMRQKLGTAGLMSRKAAKKKGINFDEVRLEPVLSVSVGWQREAAWDNVLARHRDSIDVTTWTTRKQCVGTHRLVHPRFDKNPDLYAATATSECLSPCGNFAFIGYSTGHVDKFNVQSGRLVHTFHDRPKEAQDERAHENAVTGLSVDARAAELVTACADGCVRFWNLRTGRCVAGMRSKAAITRLETSRVSSLIAASLKADSGECSIAIIDQLTRRVVRTFKQVGEALNAVTFSSDGKWLLAADGEGHIRVWELATSHLIDVMMFSSPCVGVTFSPDGEYIATCHKDQRAIYVWASKAAFSAHHAPIPLPADFVPTWDTVYVSTSRETILLDDDDDEDDEEMEEGGVCAEPSPLIVYSGLPPSRWANLPDLALIRERNKPVEPAKKPKAAPFFLAATQTLDGFEFEKEVGETAEDRKILQAKRSALELESSFSQKLRNASTPAELMEVFGVLRKMSLSAIDFQLRSLLPDSLPALFNMFLQMLRCRRDFDLVQAYMAAALRIHRSSLWEDCDPELTEILEQLAQQENEIWSPYDDVLVENAAVVQWTKNALI